ncbi:MAG: glycerophosphodiester phosphodiesterase family protein [Ignavibacteria bacterium]|nr:glycerophosphodiester phosphodiesterase family protein [Ignavibacteria bacterium]
MKIPFLVAHRGAPNLSIENTIQSFIIAFEQNADFIEGDFWLTKDEEIVCIHDENTYRLTHKKFNLKVTESNLHELKKIDFIEKKFQQKLLIPTLEEIFDIIPHGKGLFLEIKDDRKKFLDVLLSKIIRSDFSLNNLRIISYFPEILKYCKEILPQVKTYWIFDSLFIRDYCRNKIVFMRFLNTIKSINCNGLVMHSESNINSNFVQRLHECNLEICVYGANDYLTVKKLVNIGVDYITTDNLMLCREVLNEEINQLQLN